MRVSLHHCIVLISGYVGTGKSCLLHSNPDIYVLNLNRSSTPFPPKASLWPGVRSDGTPVEPDPNATDPSDPEQGIPVTVTWPMLEAKRDILLEMAKGAVAERPRMAGIDDLDTLFELATDHILYLWNRDHPDNQKHDFGDIGQGNQYGDRSLLVQRFIESLYFAGYGVVITTRLTDMVVNDKATKQRTRYEMQPAIRAADFTRIAGICDFVGITTTESRGGGAAVAGRAPTPKRTVYLLSFDKSPENPEVKSRFPDMQATIELPRGNAWGAFEAAFNKALAPTT